MILKKIINILKYIHKFLTLDNTTRKLIKTCIFKINKERNSIVTFKKKLKSVAIRTIVWYN